MPKESKEEQEGTTETHARVPEVPKCAPKKKNAPTKKTRLASNKKTTKEKKEEKGAHRSNFTYE